MAAAPAGSRRIDGRCVIGRVGEPDAHFVTRPDQVLVALQAQVVPVISCIITKRADKVSAHVYGKTQTNLFNNKTRTRTRTRTKKPIDDCERYVDLLHRFLELLRL